jgi:hypothetical protein
MCLRKTYTTDFATSFGFVPYMLTTLLIMATSIVLIHRAGERPLGEKGHTTRGNHIGPLGALIRVG